LAAKPLPHVEAQEADVKGPGDHAGPKIQAATSPIERDERADPSNQTSAASNNDKAPQEESTQSAKVSRAQRDNGDPPTWRQEDETASKEEPGTSKQEVKQAVKEDKAAAKEETATSTEEAKYTTPEGAKISDVTRIFKQLSLQSARDRDLTPPEKFRTEVQAEQFAEDWDSDATQVEEMDVKDDAHALDQGLKVAREKEFMAQGTLLHSELALCEEETVSIREDLLQFQAISQNYEDCLVEVTATFEDARKDAIANWQAPPG
ncbi:hypothetical protein BGX23_000961, partial [Mortierella sp. AD031]